MYNYYIRRYIQYTSKETNRSKSEVLHEYVLESPLRKVVVFSIGKFFFEIRPRPAGRQTPTTEFSWAEASSVIIAEAIIRRFFSPFEDVFRM